MSNVADPPLSPAAAAERDAHLTALSARMAGKKMLAEVADGVLTVFTMTADDGPRPRLTIGCTGRPTDGDAWWFKAGETWVAPASHTTDAIMWVLGRLAGNRP